MSSTHRQPNGLKESPARQEQKSTDQSRRRFLAATALVAASGAVIASADEKPTKLHIPSGAPKPRIPVDENETIRLGIIGTGGMGTGHCHRFIDMAKEGRCNARIVALCDVCKPRLESTHKQCVEKQGGEIDMIRDADELLARDDIHAVLIALPEHWHAQMAIKAIHAGKDVYLEKPMTLRFNEALVLRDVVNKSDQILQVGTQHMMLPKYKEAKRLLADKAVGHPTLSQTSYCRNSPDGEWNYYYIDPQVKPGEMLDWDAWCGPLGPQPWDPAVYARWRRYRKFSTGIVGDLLVHQMTPLIYALDPGWPVRVTATGGHYVDKAMENHDQVNITIQFEKEHTMIVVGSTCNEVGLETMVRGNKANIRMGGSNVVLRPERVYVDEVEEKTINTPHVPDQDLLRLNWLHSVRTREPNMSRVDLGTKIMAIVEMATRSMWEGSAYGFDPHTMKIRKL